MVDPAPILRSPEGTTYLALVLDILGSTAVKVRSDLKDKFTSDIEEFMLEEYTPERVLELKEANVH